MVSVVRFDRWQNTLGSQYNNIIQVQFVSWSSVTSTTTIQAYQTVTGGTLSITPLLTNSKFLIIPVCQGYMSGAGGTNIGVNRTVGGTTTRIIGADGASGDTWMGSGNGFGTNSFGVARQYLDSPSVTAGTAITYQVLLGLWSAGTTSVNYATSYSPTSTLTVFEIQP